MESDIIQMFERMSMKTKKCPINPQLVEYIDPYSTSSKTKFTPDLMLKVLRWISDLINVVKEYDKLEDFSLPEHLNILTTAQIFIYYAVHHRLSKEQLPEMIFASFITTQLIFNDYSELSKKNILKMILSDLAPENKKWLYDPDKVMKNQIKLVKFFDYDFYHLAITANYLILLNKCLDLNEPTDDYDFISKFEDSVEKNVFDHPENLSMNPHEITKMLIQDSKK